jgi:hypothetical protein
MLKNEWIIPPILCIPSEHAQEELYILRVLPKGRLLMAIFGHRESDRNMKKAA